MRRRQAEPILLSCLGVDLELVLLPHFLAHYAALGVAAERIHVLLNATDPSSPRLAEAEALLAAHGAAPPHRWIGPYTSEAMWHERRELQRRVADPRDWVINADVDEHHDYPAPLGSLIAYCERKRYTCVQGMMIDRLAPGGELARVDARPSLARQFPLAAEVAVPLFGRVRGAGLEGTFKLMLHRADVLPQRGGHNVSPEGAAPRYLFGTRLGAFARSDDPRFRLRFPFRVWHYKWNSLRRGKIHRRVATPGASEAGVHFGAGVLDYLARHDRIRPSDVATGDPAVRVRAWKALALRMRLEARFAARRGAPGTPSASGRAVQAGPARASAPPTQRRAQRSSR